VFPVVHAAPREEPAPPEAQRGRGPGEEEAALRIDADTVSRYPLSFAHPEMVACPAP
jgi:hypothetical protein